MSTRIVTGSSLRLAACAAALAFARPLAAQEPRVFISGGDKIVFGGMLTVPISDETIRSLIQTHLPEELRQDDARYVVLVLDANDQYVSSKAGKAAVITGDGSGAFIVGDTTGMGGSVVIRRTSTGNSSETSGGSVVSVFGAKMGDDTGSGVFGSGFSMSEISSIGLRRFTAGQLGTSAIIVSVVKLKQ